MRARGQPGVVAQRTAGVGERQSQAQMLRSQLPVSSICSSFAQKQDLTGASCCGGGGADAGERQTRDATGVGGSDGDSRSDKGAHPACTPRGLRRQKEEKSEP